MRKFFRRLQYLLQQRRIDAELMEEIETHRAMRQRDLEARGLDPADALPASRRTLGNATLAREDARRVWISPWLESVWQDARYAVRTLLREPVHTVTAVAVLVLAIGLNVSLYSTVKAVAFEPWPARDPDRVVRVRAAGEGRPIGPTLEEWRLYRDQARSFSAVAVHIGNLSAPVRATARAETQAACEWVSANFFDMLGVRLHLGSGFIPEDDRPGGRAVVVLGYFFWKHYFGSDPSVIGQTITAYGKPLTIVGVLEPRMDGLSREEDLWLPLATVGMTGSVGGPSLDAAGMTACCVGMAGRLAPGVSREEARVELQMLHERYALAHKHKPGVLQVFGTEQISMPGNGDFDILGALFAGVGLVLVLACANVGNLQLARGLARRREISTRLAIGASRGRVVRQLVVEGLVLAGIAGAASIGVAAVLPGVIFRWLGEEIPPGIAGRFLPDAQVVAVTAAICVAACIFFGLAPALQATRRTIPLSTMDRGGTRSARFSLRGTLLAVQIAACTVLLVGAGLVTRAIAHAMAFDPGFQIQGLARISAHIRGEEDPNTQRMFVGQLLAQLEQDATQPVALAEFGPMNPASYKMTVALSRETVRESRYILQRGASRLYFDLLGIPLEKGRMYASDARDEAVVNQAFERAVWPAEGAIGKTIHQVNNRQQISRSFTIVGVVRDTWLTGPERIEPVVFRPTLSGAFYARGPASIERVRATALGLNAAAAVTVTPVSEELSGYLEESRIGATVAGAIGVLGLLLASVGVFGVFAYSVEERRREIGLRLALGAAGSQIVKMLVSTAGRAMLFGLGAGLLGSLASGPVLGSYLFGLSPLDPAAYAGVVLLLATAGIMATFVPARRACRVDPAVTLRED